jgi:glycosyltransferase involved in cell wall biosynthesis
MTKPRVLILAEDCNPEWPSLPIVGYKYAHALMEVAEVTVVTHIRNRENIDKADQISKRVEYIDNEWIASPMYKAATFLRGGTEVAWSTNQMMAYLPYVAFEWQALRKFRKKLEAGEFDIVHRITPMSPTLPSYFSGRTSQPFILGPLNGNLDWPAAFIAEQKREKEGMRRLRNLYKYLPFARATYRKADCIMAAFNHTKADLEAADPAKIVSIPEVGFDPEIFHAQGRQPAFAHDGQKRFLYAGRMVPYKVPEVVVRAFVTSEQLKPHVLHMLGEGPELPRLMSIVKEAGAESRVLFEGRKTQAEVAEFMRRADAFVFPSIRELGAGVIIEAMAAGPVCIVTNYGAPGDLVGNDRGIRVELGPLDWLVKEYRSAMESCLVAPEAHAEIAERAREYANALYTWSAKANFTLRLYEAVHVGKPLTEFTEYS